jgi:hypothetical protein
MRFRVTFEYDPSPFEPDDYLRPGVVDVLCLPEVGDEQVAARLAFDHLDISRIIDSGESLMDVCDADSQGWLNVYEALFEPHGNNGELRREFEFDELVFDVLFIHRAVFHPSIENWVGYILDHVSKLIDTNSATVMWQKIVGLSDRVLADIGFRRIAGEQLLFRPNMLQHACDKEHRLANPSAIRIDEDAGDFVRKAWGDELE